MSSERRVFNSSIAAISYSPKNAFIHLKHFLGQFLSINLVCAVFEGGANLRDAIVIHFRIITKFLLQLLQVLGLIAEAYALTACRRTLSLGLLGCSGAGALAARGFL